MYVFDSGDAQGLARILDEVAMHPDRLLSYSAKLKVARERMLWSRERDKYITLLRQLTGVKVLQGGRDSKNDATVT
jgi:hypothetical protein